PNKKFKNDSKIKLLTFILKGIVMLLFAIGTNLCLAQGVGDTTTKLHQNASSGSGQMSLRQAQLSIASDSVSSAPVQAFEVYKLGYENDPKEKNSAGIGDIIVIKVHNLKALLNRSNCLDANVVDNFHITRVRKIGFGFVLLCLVFI